jgi:hypothetical protein
LTLGIPYAVLHRQARIFIRIDFGQDKFAVWLRGQALQKRRQHAARAAPGRPEIDDHRLLVGALNDLPLKIGLVNFDDL